MAVEGPGSEGCGHDLQASSRVCAGGILSSPVPREHAATPGRGRIPYPPFVPGRVVYEDRLYEIASAPPGPVAAPSRPEVIHV
jgi:hypothetical protein